MPHAAEWDWIHDHYGELQRVVRTAATDAVAGTLPHSVTWPSWRGYTMKQLRRLWRERNYILGATGAAVIVARAIGGVTPRCVKKGPIGKVARALCGIPTHLLNDLLGILADVWILQNVCVLLPYLETAAKDIGTPLVAGLTEVGAGLCKGNKAPAALVGPMPSIPTLVFGVTASGV
jgi:hypothetical protein